MVMFCCCHSSSTSALLFVLLSLTPLLALQQRPSAISGVHEDSGAAERAAWTPGNMDSLLQNPMQHVSDVGSASSLASVLLEALDHPTREKMNIEAEPEEGLQRSGGDLEQNGEKNELNNEPLGAAQGEEDEGEEKTELKAQWPKDEGNEKEAVMTAVEEKDESLLKAESQSNIATPIQRKTRGYFQNIDLGLQDNEIFPPLKGYKAYNQQLAESTKKLKWEDEKTKNPSQLERNFMDDFDFVEEEEEILTRKEEEARARAEQEEVMRQEAEAQEAREEEQRLADIASDMLLEYMGRKQKTSTYMRDMKAALLNNVAEDKRSNEVEDGEDDDEMDPQTIDKLIEISSKLHLPADDVVEIISDVQEKKKKRKDLPPPSNAPRFRPLVPLKAKPRPKAYQHPQKPPKKSSHAGKPYKKWYKGKNKGKLNKQGYWFKPQKQFLAYPSFPYYQKPYRAYYPVFFPPQKPRFYTNPALSFDYNFGGSMGYDFRAPNRRYRDRATTRDWNWTQPPKPDTVISNYILPHPRTYQALPMPKPRSPPSVRAPSYLYPPDYVYDEPESPQGSDEELENFIEKIYYNRRLY